MPLEDLLRRLGITRMRHQPKILVVQSDADTARSTASALLHHGFRPAVVHERVSARQSVYRSRPGAVLLDIDLADGSGLELLRGWRDDMVTRELPIIMLTPRSAEVDKLESLSLGADDYVSIPFSVPELMARVRAVMRRVPGPPGDVLAVDALTLEAATWRVAFDDRPIQLRAVEFRLLQYLMRNTDRVVSRAELMLGVWDSAHAVKERTVDVHVKMLRSALGPGGRLIKTVRHEGYCMDSTMPEAGA